MENDAEFNPKRYLTRVGGNDYLPVPARVLWLREKHPEAIISTELIEHNTNDQSAIFRAHVIIPGGGEATGWGSESYDDFRDYLEKAETKALGRALAVLGYGTQFAGDDFAEVDRILPQQGAAQRGNKSGGGSKPQKLATDEQIGNMRAWQGAQGLTPEQMAQIVLNITGRHDYSQMTDQEAGRVLYKLNRVALTDLLAGNID